MSKRILGITYIHENNTLGCASHDYCEAFRQKGHDATFVNVGDPDGLKHFEDELESGELLFCFGLQGVGSNLNFGDVNLWTHYRIPFLCLHYDNPCYNRHNHLINSPYVANIYHWQSFFDIQRRYLGGDQYATVLPVELFGKIVPPTIPFAERPIKLLYIKSGEGVEKFVEYFNSIPEALSKGVWDALDRAKHDPNMLLCDVVQELFVKNGYDRAAYTGQFWAVVQSMDFYLRRQRAIDFVNWLKMQPDAIIIGNGWDFIDRSGVRAEFRPAIPLDEAVKLYGQTQFVCNTHPYGADLVHERVIWGLGSNSCVITDTNRWWDENFSGLPSLKRFGWGQSLDGQLQDFIADTAKAAQNSVLGRDAIMKQFDRGTYIDHVLETVEKVRAFADERIKLQPQRASAG